MFILTSNEVKSAMFAMDLKVEYDLKHAIYKSRIRIPELYHEGDYGGMRSVPVRKATPTSIFERAEFEQRDTGCRPLRCMGTSPDNHTRRMPILCHVHGRLLQAHLDLSDETEERSVWTLPEV